MADDASPLRRLSGQFETGEAAPRSVAERALERANSNAARNVYLGRNAAWTLQEADGLDSRFREGEKPALYGLPVALKDCLDLAGFVTTCGSRFYAGNNGVAREDSAVAARLRAQGAVITGKTHIHQLTYGITGQNPDYGDCVQPGHAEWLTGGSSSGAAASVMEGSAIAAIGTDTRFGYRRRCAGWRGIGARLDWLTSVDCGAAGYTWPRRLTRWGGCFGICGMGRRWRRGFLIWRCRDTRLEQI